MTNQEITELAAILVNEYGHAALEVAERRRDQYAQKPDSDLYRVWARIAEATARLLKVRERERTPAECRDLSCGGNREGHRGRRTW